MRRRRFIRTTTLAGSAVLIGGGIHCQPDNELRTSLPGKKILFVYGGLALHQPDDFRDLYVPWLRSNGANVITSDSLDIYADEETMSGLDLIIQIWTMGEIRSEQLNGLLGAVRNGSGLAGWHGGLSDSFRSEPAYSYMIGGQFVAHPGGIIPYTVHPFPTHIQDPIMDGIEAFRVETEQYYMHVDPNVKVLATTRFDGTHDPWLHGSVMPVVWKKHFGKGRVFFSALGHKVSDHEVAESWEIMTRGILWAVDSRNNQDGSLVTPVYNHSY